VADGINIKLMKCGGVSEALRMIHAARAHGLQTMLGCYGNSALANTAAAHLGPLVDHLDLDSHLNLSDDPFTGVRLAQGRLVLPGEPGFGVRHEPTH
jgi:muconate cycloisomerase